MGDQGLALISTVHGRWTLDPPDRSALSLRVDCGEQLLVPSAGLVWLLAPFGLCVCLFVLFIFVFSSPWWICLSRQDAKSFPPVPGLWHVRARRCFECFRLCFPMFP
eukprot:m.14893 g.14893  ORF g.14893 m.14893 type:complete len:107 (+) comp4925_c0_seq1:952-1272(+)